MKVSQHCNSYLPFLSTSGLGRFVRGASRVPSRHCSRSQSHSHSNPNLRDWQEKDRSEQGGSRSYFQRRHCSSSRRHRSHCRPRSCSYSPSWSQSALHSSHRQKGKQAVHYALATPTKQRGQKRQPISMVIPIPYAKNLEAGWRDYMALSGFTAAKCSVHFVSSQKDVVTPAGGSIVVAPLQQDGTLNVKADHFSTMDEMKLSYNDFGPVVKNFVTAICTHLIPSGCK